MAQGDERPPMTRAVVHGLVKDVLGTDMHDNKDGQHTCDGNRARRNHIEIMV